MATKKPQYATPERPQDNVEQLEASPADEAILKANETAEQLAAKRTAEKEKSLAAKDAKIAELEAELDKSKEDEGDIAEEEVVPEQIKTEEAIEDPKDTKKDKPKK